MGMEDIAIRMEDLLADNRVIYLRLEPEVPDFTEKASFNISFWGKNSGFQIEVNPENLLSVISLLDVTVFNKERVDRVLTWNFKALASYFHFFNPKFVTPQNSLVDLQIIEGFLGIRKKRPENYTEAVNRTKIIIQNKSWMPIYKAVHLPLALRVLPSIETTPVLDEEVRRGVHPYYEIEGQANGRMNCMKKFKYGYLPHNMGLEVKTKLKPRGNDLRFVCSDFRHCEVTVLEYLSHDARLKEIINSGDDLHSKIYEIILNNACDTEKKRTMSKLMFLPIMFGCGPGRLGKMLAITDDNASELIRRVQVAFRTAWEWMMAQQEEAKRGEVQDFFGRPRTFEPDQCYLVRNFKVQAVAATVCQEKMIDLHNALEAEKAKMVFSVHDGFGLVTPIPAARKSFDVIKSTLETESKLCPGLFLKAKVTFGAKLDSMKELWK